MPSTCPKCKAQFSGPSIGKHADKCGVTSSDLFWSKVRKGERCWIWMGAKHFRGYGACSLRYGDTRAHRVSWAMTNGPIPKGLGVLHRCNTMLCVNPRHLYLGDQKQNAADCEAAGRRNSRWMPVEELLHPHLSRRGQMTKRSGL